MKLVGWRLLGPVLGVVFMLPTIARADTMAEVFQAPQPFRQWPPAGSPVSQLLANVGLNQEYAWPDMGGPSPNGLPANATRVLISKYYYSTSWTQGCSTICTVQEISFSMSIYFLDGSVYFYQYMSQHQVCSDGQTTSDSRSTSILDTADMAEPDCTRIRSCFKQVSSQHNRIDRADKVVVMAPAGSIVAPGASLGVAVPPDVTLEVRLAPGATLDLSGYDGSAPLVGGAGRTDIYADSVLLGPGVALGQLFSGSPQVHPGSEARSLWLTPLHAPTQFAGSPDVVRYRLSNLGNTPESGQAAWSDTQGWCPLQTLPFSLAPGEGTDLNLFMMIPAQTPICGFTEATLTADAGGADAVAMLTILGDGDADGDFVKNSVDTCWNVSNLTQGDLDQDGVGNVCDNCFAIFNPFQEDADGDGQGNACDPPCPADLDDGYDTGIPDGGVDIGDLLFFLRYFEAGNILVDLDDDGEPSVAAPDGGVDVSDLLFFLFRFESGC